MTPEHVTERELGTNEPMSSRFWAMAAIDLVAGEHQQARPIDPSRTPTQATSDVERDRSYQPS